MTEVNVEPCRNGGRLLGSQYDDIERTGVGIRFGERTPTRWSKWRCQGVRNVSRVFWLLLSFFIFVCFMAALVDHVVFLILVVITGWLISLTLHEFGHAIVAYKGGDYTVAEMGYLTLDITRYIDPMMTFIVPTALLVFGGMPLPGGAVSIMTANLHDRKWETLTSLAGPFANFVFGAIVSVFFHIYTTLAVKMSRVQSQIGPDLSVLDSQLGPALSLLMFYQMMAVVLNLIPLPPLDGWGALSPWLSSNCFLKRWLRNPWHEKSITLLCFLLLFVGIYSIPHFTWAVSKLSLIYGLDPEMLDRGNVELSAAYRTHV